ncbi:MAG TPA: APC family permease [Candidatus Dormibacteraeota bacterium]|nr:APC family permease [Candidatus Dormibacteraeota bacterium]
MATQAARQAPRPELRRAVTPWGSFSWGYSDVGADIFIGLGLVLAAAAGASNVAFLFAGMVYVCIGLAYTELAAAYPFAGGGPYFVLRGLGDVFGFIAGWAVLLDFTIDITLFAWSCIDYSSQLLPVLVNSNHPWVHFAAVLGLIVGLCVLNVIGVRESTAFNGIVSALDVVSETCILCFGFLFAFQPELLIHNMSVSWPSPYHLMLGTSLAIISFVGLESISQAAQETYRPASVIPRTSVALILTILIFALAYSNLALGMQPWHPIVGNHGQHLQFWQIFPSNPDNQGKAVALLAAQVPYWGAIAALYVPVLGAILLLISSNSGVFGSSRIAYSMSRADLLPSLFQRVHPRFRTPMVSIVAFCGLAAVTLVFAALPALFPGAMSFYARVFHGESGLDFLADLYAFGAATSYSFVFLALIALRLIDPHSPRKFKIPLNIPVRFRGEQASIPLLGIVGFAGIFSILVFTLMTHPIGRIAGPSWLIVGVILYFVYRRHRRLPYLRSQKHDWRRHQMEILRTSGDLELLDEYTANLKAAENRAGNGPHA